MQTTIVSADWLMAQDSTAITILDASYFLPTMGRDGRSEFAEEHIVGAAFFDIDAIKERDEPFAPYDAGCSYRKPPCAILAFVRTNR